VSHDVVVGVNRKSRHYGFPLFRALRGQHMDDSAGLERQGNSETKRRGRTDGDGRGERGARLRVQPNPMLRELFGGWKPIRIRSATLTR
jgi:hypothetical protein